MPSPTSLRIEPSREEDISRLMQLVIPPFEDMPYCQLVGDTSTPENLEKAGERHIRTWREHATYSHLPVSIKCVHVDPVSSEETIVSTAEWFIYARTRTEKEYTTSNYLLSAAWVTDEEIRSKAQAWRQPVLDGRVRWMGGRPCAVLMYMATDPAFARRGAATMCVQWGLDRCKDLGIPAILEASEEGLPLYRKLGFELMEEREIYDPTTDGMRTTRFMVAWPEGTTEEDKRPALPGYGVR